MLNGHLAQIPSEIFSADKVLSNYMYVFFAAFLVALFLTPAMRVVALHFGIVDRPDRNRKMHGTPVAYLGGVAVFVAWLSGMFISQFMVLHRIEPGWPKDPFQVAHPLIPVNIVLGALVIVLLGLWDDARGLKPWIKITGQVVAAVILLLGGSGIEATRPLD